MLEVTPILNGYLTQIVFRPERFEKMGLFEDRSSTKSCHITRAQKAKIIGAIGVKCLAKGQKHAVPREALDLQHIKPRAMGGSDKLENLTVLCATHHRLAHAGKVIQQSIVEFLSPRRLATLEREIKKFSHQKTDSNPWKLF